MMNLATPLIFVLGLFQLVHGHGYLKNPPARNYMWKAGFGTPRNYNFNQLWCGGKKNKIYIININFLMFF